MDTQNKLKKEISLKELTTFRIGGKAKYFLEASNKEEVIEAIKWAKENSLPFFILGGGSNVLINDKKYKGLVIKLQTTNYKLLTNSMEVGAGLALGKIVGLALQNSLAGMEWAMGIPGTIGGAVYGNAGAFNQSISDAIEEVEVIDSKNQELRIKNYKKEECGFGYRDSIFKRDKNLIILSVKIKLQLGNKKEIENKMNEYFQKKKQTQPLEFFSAGSIFKNPEKFKAGELIEKTGLKGKRIGGVEISQKHANFIVNNGRGASRDAKKLIDLIKKQANKKFNIVLEEEIQLINF